LDTPAILSKPLEKIKDAAASAVRPPDDATTDDEITGSAATSNGHARYTEEPTSSEPPAVLDTKAEDELPPLRETQLPAPPLLPPESPEKKKAEEKKLEAKVAPTPPANKSRDVEKSANPQDAEKAKKRQNVLTRTIWTFIMIAGFLGKFSCSNVSVHYC
jgi:phosphatidate cytidylyltransferase